MLQGDSETVYAKRSEVSGVTQSGIARDLALILFSTSTLFDSELRYMRYGLKTLLSRNILEE